MPVLSVIIAAHNSEDTFQNTLENLILAIDDADEIEVIIVNDASIDSTQNIIDNYSSHFARFKTDKVNYKNVGATRQHALDIAEGDYITMLDSDDELRPKSLRSAVNFLKINKPDILLSHVTEYFDITKTPYTPLELSPQRLNQDEAIRKFLIHKELKAFLCGQFISKELYDKNPIPPMTCYEDFAIFPSVLMQADNIWYQKESLYSYIKRHGSTSSEIDSDKISNLIICTSKMDNLFPSRFKNLKLCHWIDIICKHNKALNSYQQMTLRNKITHECKASFFLSGDVRFSFKKKAVKILWKN